MSTERIDAVGAQPNDPAWARLLFVVLEGRDGQCWRAVLLLTPLLLLLVAGLVVVTTAAPVGWIGGALGVGGSLTAALAMAKRRRPRS